MTRVKICGLREAEHAIAAVDAGADMLGFIFYPPVRRYVDPRHVRALLDRIRRVEVVGVFVNEEAARIEEIADLLDLDLVQLSGDEPTELTGRIGRPVARTVHVDAATTVDQVSIRGAGARLIHLDTKRTGEYGGTGARFDWRLAKSAGALGPVLLAGGLDATNVAEAIEQASPWGVDVSSGVEREKRKDHQLIREFLRTVRALDGVRA
jgi:phosphoribosylanthranilate isomerase